MITRSMDVRIPQGLDPSTIALFIQIASQYESSVYVEVDNKKVNAKSLMGMMTLGIPEGGVIDVIADGNDETLAIEHIEKYLMSSDREIREESRSRGMTLPSATDQTGIPPRPTECAACRASRPLPFHAAPKVRSPGHFRS